MKTTTTTEKTSTTSELTLKESHKTYLLPASSSFIENQSTLISLLKQKINQLSKTILSMEEQLYNYEMAFKEIGKKLAVF